MAAIWTWGTPTSCHHSMHIYFPQEGPSKVCTNCSLRKFAFFSAWNSSPAKLSTSAHSTPGTAISYVTTQFWMGTDQSGRQRPCKRTPPPFCHAALQRTDPHSTGTKKVPCSVIVLFVWSTVDVGGSPTNPYISRALYCVTCALSDMACMGLESVEFKIESLPTEAVYADASSCLWDVAGRSNACRLLLALALPDGAEMLVPSPRHMPSEPCMPVQSTLGVLF